jgi:hypothetical protein
MKSSAQLEREAREQRVQLSATLEQLGDSMSAKQLSSELLTLAKDSGVSIVRTLAHSARDNPIPALLIGVGLVMMMTKGSGDKDGADLAAKAGDILKDAAQAGASALKGAAASVGKAASSVAHAAGDAVSGAKENIEGMADKARHASESGLNEADSVVRRGKEEAKHLADEAQSLARQGKDALQKLADEQPVLLAAVGAVLGAALGAALPVSEAERRYLGRASSQAVRAGRETAAKVADVVKGETLGDHPETKVSAVAEKVLRVVTKDISKPVEGKDAGQTPARY